MSKLIAAPAAQGNVATLFVGFELSKSTWLIGLMRRNWVARSAATRLTAAIWKRPLR
jgi:hypothetical protein